MAAYRPDPAAADRKACLMRLGFVVLLAALLGACSSDTPVAPANATESPEMVAKNCADPQWKDKNLGLWYSVCRRPMSW